MLQLPTPPEDACWLQRQVEEGLGNHGSLKVFMEAGMHEPLVHQVSGQMATLLSRGGHRVHYRAVEGGHDALCWRGGLLDGLQALWQPTFATAHQATPAANPRLIQGARDGHAEPV
ncbi:Ferric enterobactin esterase [Serratia rubidaea]|uniref:Ferric enterobactin esterase n=2 Tax=Serratia rubidaea TaxID=61652 RepID=A0A4U9HSJ3_SERRU|nr:Ferric enterobactin esterase [Serratia rubidaea]